MQAIARAFSPYDRQVHVALVARNADDLERSLMSFCGLLMHSGAQVPEDDKITCEACLTVQRWIAVGSRQKR